MENKIIMHHAYKDMISSPAALLQAALHWWQACDSSACCGISVFACKACSSRQDRGKHHWIAPCEPGPECDNLWLSREIKI